MSEIALIFAVVVAVNLLPAFGPPTWSIMVLFTLSYDINKIALILTGVAAAASGRFLLATGTRASRNFLPSSYVANMESFGEYIKQKSTHAWWLIGMFFVSPLPSAQLFVAAGLMPQVPLAPITGAFAIGRVFTYSLYVAIAHSVSETNAGQVIKDHLTSPWGLGTELLMLGLLIAMGRINWKGKLKH
jgi:hypothetical protein